MLFASRMPLQAALAGFLFAHRLKFFCEFFSFQSLVLFVFSPFIYVLSSELRTCHEPVAIISIWFT
jgi:hypothetical protein